ncbi:aminoglycoside phosphotransferase family protein [Marinibacterium sp. SX1]|uniref:aminoglycoside phosphotransferase family protein n=1 Tax=Marinibacterium sp. SX1 TaxID=3388424 RepID=UPI003D1639A5
MSTSLAKELVDRGMPEWAGQPVRPLAATGTDNWMFRLGSDKILRLPRRPSAVTLLRREWDWLPALRGLPLAVPEPLALGEPDPAYPHPWMVLKWQPGETLATRPPTNALAAADSLGAFARALRNLPGTGGPIAGSANHNRGVPLATIDGTTRRCIGDLARSWPLADLSGLWADAMAAPPWSGAPLWLHGDLSAGNLLGNAGRLTGVIDFGLMARGDPAVDLIPAWSLFEGAARDAFLQAAGADRDMIRRGRGWALYSGVVALAYYGENHPTLSRISARTLEAVLGDA